jgi:spore coat protein CotF
MKNTQLNDEQIVKDILSYEKALAKLYMDAIIESSCPEMRKTLTDVHIDVSNNQFDTFKYMEENDLYPIEYAQSQKLEETINKFSS